MWTEVLARVGGQLAENSLWNEEEIPARQKCPTPHFSNRKPLGGAGIRVCEFFSQRAKAATGWSMGVIVPKEAKMRFSVKECEILFLCWLPDCRIIKIL